MSNRSSLRQKKRAPRVSAPSNTQLAREARTSRAGGSGNLSQPWFPVVTRSRALIPASLREDMIRDAAYLRAQARDFTPGAELEDWLAAEQEVDELIVRRYAC
ncbi:MAG: DUF2934 domain-containing protein [Proteobacteria bacterium]|nr:DUF2934 domain-containing protein [Pseudomonadota bacterium]